MLTSKGASGVTGAGFITLAATLTIVPTIPIVSLAVLVGIDRFMSQCRALTNAIGNGVATLVWRAGKTSSTASSSRANWPSGPPELAAAPQRQTSRRTGIGPGGMIGP